MTFGPPCVLAQPSMQTILANGPVSNRLNIVVLSEGYTSGQLAQFAVYATNAVNALLSTRLTGNTETISTRLPLVSRLLNRAPITRAQTSITTRISTAPTIRMGII